MHIQFYTQFLRMRHQNDLLSTYFHFATFTWSNKQFLKSLLTPRFSCPGNTKYMYFTLFTKVQLLDPIISIGKISTHIEYTTVSLSHCSSRHTPYNIVLCAISLYYLHYCCVYKYSTRGCEVSITTESSIFKINL